MKRLRAGLARLARLASRVRVDMEDLLLLSGLALLGVGLYLLAGLGVAMTVVGGLLLLGGVGPAVLTALAARGGRPPAGRR